MSDSMEDLFLGLARETPLLDIGAVSRKPNTPFTTKPYTRARAKFDQQTRLPPSPPLRPPTSNKKRSCKPEFNIFVDANAVNASSSPPPKKLKPNARVPLSIRTDSANLTPAPSPRYPDTPFPFSPSDPLWANVENYDAGPYYITPPSTPRGPSPTPSLLPHTSPHRPTRAPRPHQAQQVPSSRPLPPPKDITLYMALELNTWRATTEEIKVAYKKYAGEHHPDKVTAARREEANHLMATANAAKEVLLDSKRRRAYHKSGRLPWTT